MQNHDPQRAHRSAHAPRPPERRAPAHGPSRRGPVRPRAGALLATALCLAGLAAGGAFAQSAAPTRSAAAGTPSAARPGEFENLDAWLDAKRAQRVPALPLEARVYFRRATIAQRTGNQEEALRLARGAVELDPTFLGARVALLRWELSRDPAQALAQASGLVDLVRRDFATQWSTTSNAIYLVVQAWMLAVLATATLVVAARFAELRHALSERLGRWASPTTTVAYTLALLSAPFVLGYGIALPVVAFLGMLWPGLKWRERAVAVLLLLTLVAQPITTRALGRLSLPMNAAEAPISALLPLEMQPDDATRREVFQHASQRFPESPFVAFGRGWLAQRDGAWAEAEAAYGAALRAWPNDDRVLDDLGIVLVQQGRRDEAIERYQQAVKANPANATAWFNLSQAHTQGYDFDAATRALARASALDFDRVREYKNQPAHAGSLTLVPEWLSPARVWRAFLPLDLRHPQPEVPMAPWGRMSPFGDHTMLAAAVAALLGLVLGLRFHRTLPLHRCSNCGRVVCRRCSERRRAQALCRPCARVAAGAASPDFARVLLERQRRRGARTSEIARIIFATLVPGAGLVFHRRVWRALLLILTGATLALAVSPMVWPYAGRPRSGPLGVPDVPGAWVPIIVVCALSLWGYAQEQVRARRRATQAAHAGPRRTGTTLRLREPENPASGVQAA